MRGDVASNQSRSALLLVNESVGDLATSENPSGCMRVSQGKTILARASGETRSDQRARSQLRKKFAIERATVSG